MERLRTYKDSFGYDVYKGAKNSVSSLSLYRQRFLRYLPNNYSAKYSTAAANYSVVQLLAMDSCCSPRLLYLHSFHTTI